MALPPSSLPPAPHSLLLITVSDPVLSLGGLLFGTTLRSAFAALDGLRSPGARVAPTPVPMVPVLSDRDRAEPLSAPLLGLPIPSGLPPPLRPIWTPSVLLPICTLVIPLRVIRTPTGHGSNRKSLCVTSPTNTFSPAGHWHCPPKC